MSNLVRKIGGMFGGGHSNKKKWTLLDNQKRPDLVMPDDLELQRAARRRQALLAQRSGRRSTILDEDMLG